MEQPGATSYDQFPYTSHAFHETHPDHLAVLARLHGLQPRDPAGCRVLEIGCASGGNLIPMALELPGAEFLGIDLSRVQVNEATRIASELGLSRIQFLHADLAALPGDLGSFDYIIAHGIFSWIDEPRRRLLLDLCAARLTPAGVAYISYNCYPGWHPLSMLREMMLYHAERVGEDDKAAQLGEVRRFVGLLDASLSDRQSPYASFLKLEIQNIKDRSDSDLLHDQLETFNKPYALHEFAGMASAHGLRYLCDARSRTWLSGQLPPIRQAVDVMAGHEASPVVKEQYLDFIRNRTFRRSLLVAQEQSPLDVPSAEAIQSLRAQALAWPVSPVPELYTAHPEEFVTQDNQRRMETNNPLLKVAFQYLVEVWPRSVAFGELHARVLDFLETPPATVAAAPVDRASSTLQDALLQAFLTGTVELRTDDPPFCLIASSQPQASPYAIWQAEKGNRVTSLLHRIVELSPFDRTVLRMLDGQHDTQDLLEVLVHQAIEGVFPLTRDGQPIQDAIEIRQIMDRSLAASLKRLQASALLVS